MDERAPLSASELARAFMAFLVIAIVALGVNPFRGQIIGPFDLLLSQPGWGDKISFDQVRHAERSDVLDYYLPRWIEARKEIRNGHIPLWNPLPAGGEPGILNLAAGELTPAFALFAAAPSVPAGLLAAILFNLSFGATGVYAFMRRHGAMLSGLFVGVTVMLCGFNAAWLYWPHVSTALWIGWLLWGLDRAAHRETRYAVAGVSLPLTGLLLGGFPFVSLLGVCAGILYVFCRMIFGRTTCHRLYVRRLVLGSIIAFGLALPGLLGFAEWLREFDLSQRATGSIFSYKDIRLLFPQTARKQPAVESSMFAGSIALVLATLAMITGPVLFFVRRCRLTLLMFFSLALLACAGILVFELVPRVLLGWMPGLSNNQWSRAICLLDIAVALAAGSFIQYLEGYLRRELFIPIMLGLVVVQTADLTTYFRLFNGPVPAWTYYPKLPLVDKIKGATGTFQSTVADNSFLVSGSLGAYGVAEWFGHGFRTEALKTIFKTMAADPLTTATASSFDADTLRLDSPMLSALGVRYAIGGYGLTSSLIGLPPAAAEVAHVPMPAMPAATLVQHMRLSAPAVAEGISFNMATYGRRDQHGILQVELTRSGDPVTLARWSVPAAEIIDNRMHSFAMPVPLALQAGDYLVTLKYVNASPGDMLTVWSFPGQWPGCSASARGLSQSGCMDFGFQIKRTDLGSFVEIGSDGSIRLLENRDVPAGPYFLPTLTDYPDASSSNFVKQIHHGRSGFSLRYTGSMQGFLVTPMSWRSGWHATSNGVSVRPRKYLGVLPAIPVDGPTDLVFSYRPLGLLLGVPVAIVSLIALILGTVLKRSVPRVAVSE